MIEFDAIQKELGQLPKQERLKLAHWLLDSLVDETGKSEDPSNKENPLLKWAGMFSGGPGNTASQAEEILEAEIGNVGGFGDS
jgi:hypothetical protein